MERLRDSGLVSNASRGCGYGYWSGDQGVATGADMDAVHGADAACTLAH